MMKNLPYWGQLLVVLAFGVAMIFAAHYYYPGLGEIRHRIDELKTENQVPAPLLSHLTKEGTTTTTP